MHAQRGHATYLAGAAHFLLTIKRNQPGMLPRWRRCPGARSQSLMTSGSEYISGLRGTMLETSACEPLRRLPEKRIGAVSSTVVFVFDDMQGGQRELLGQPPGHAER